MITSCKCIIRRPKRIVGLLVKLVVCGFFWHDRFNGKIKKIVNFFHLYHNYHNVMFHLLHRVNVYHNWLDCDFTV